MDYGILSLIPILVLIIGVIITKRMLEMLIISSTLAAIIMGGTGFLTSYVEAIHKTIASGTYQLIHTVRRWRNDFFIPGFRRYERIWQFNSKIRRYTEEVNHCHMAYGSYPLLR